MRVIVCSPTWSLSGANTVCANLVRGLRQQGIDSRILLTRPDYPESVPLEAYAEVRMEELPVKRFSTWRERCRALIRYLEEHSPCIYIPNYDWGHSCISPKLSSRIVIAGIMHSVDPIYFEHLARLGKHWNGIVAVSNTIGQKVVEFDPSLAKRLAVIPNGVEIPASPCRRTPKLAGPLEIAYIGRLVQHPKRIFDLPKIMEALVAMRIPGRLTIVGAGEDQGALADMSRNLVQAGAMRFTGRIATQDALRVLEESDIFLLTSEFEGMPMSLLEAMAHGCVPVVSDVSSGIPDLIRDGINGYRVPIGDAASFAERIALLHHDVETRIKMAESAYETVLKGGYRIDDMVSRYVEFFERLMSDVENGSYVRPSGEITRPLGISPWNYRLPDCLAKVGLASKEILRKMIS